MLMAAGMKVLSNLFAVSSHSTLSAFVPLDSLSQAFAEAKQDGLVSLLDTIARRASDLSDSPAGGSKAEAEVSTLTSGLANAVAQATVHWRRWVENSKQIGAVPESEDGDGEELVTAADRHLEGPASSTVIPTTVDTSSLYHSFTVTQKQLDPPPCSASASVRGPVVHFVGHAKREDDPRRAEPHSLTSVGRRICNLEDGKSSSSSAPPPSVQQQRAALAHAAAFTSEAIDRSALSSAGAVAALKQAHLDSGELLAAARATEEIVFVADAPIPLEPTWYRPNASCYYFEVCGSCTG
jgi:hypothetical protein